MRGKKTMTQDNGKKRVLGEDYVVIKGKGKRDIYNGATVEGDTFTHLGISLSGLTACRRSIKEFFATYSDVEVDCPACIRSVNRLQ